MTIDESRFWNVSDEDYHAHTEMTSHTMLVDYWQSPANFRDLYVTKRAPKEEPTSAMILGSALHTRVLQPETYSARYYRGIKVNRSTKAGKEADLALREAAGFRTVLDPDDWDRVEAMAEALQEHPIAGEWLRKDGLTEKAFHWLDDECRHLRVKFDKIVGDPIILEVKTAANPAPYFTGFNKAFPKEAIDRGYHIQAALYRDGFRQVFGVEPRFLFLVVGNTAPHDVWVYEPDIQFFGTGMSLVRRLLVGIDSAQWHAEGQQVIQSLGAPSWARE